MKIAERLRRAHFDWTVRGILRTPALVPGPNPFIALSMVQHKDVLPYLLALKSFARFLPPARVVLVADPTLDAADRALLRQHVPHIEIREAAEFRREGIPQGGCWERLSAISEYAAQSYVIQLDADTVTTAEPAAVRQALADGVCFTLGTEDVQPIVPCTEAARVAQQQLTGDDHIQGVAEACLDRFDPSGSFRYARGCAGFAGFARGAIAPEKVRDVSVRMGALMPGRWSAWGTDQFASNLLVCSAPGGRLLPHPDYCAPTRLTPRTVFLHFIGFIRFRDTLYARLARQVSRELAAAHGAVPRHAA